MTRRTLSALAVAAIVLVPANAQAATTSASFEYGKDRSAWYWKHQQEATVGENPSLPGGVVHQQRAPNPQADDTLPVATQNGDPDKISTILFDLTGRGVTAGSTISKLTITLREGSSQREKPSFNAGGKKIQACPITEFWPAGQAELWNQRPDFDDATCAVGKRTEKGGTGIWTFDLTSLAAAWGQDPSGYNGVALAPVVADGGPAATWQLNLKIPNRDEYSKTKDRAKMTLVFTPGSGAGGFGGTSTSFPAPTGFSSSTSFPSSSGATSFPATGSSTASSGAAPGTATQTAPVANTATPAQQKVPELPAYVWLLIPVGLMALSAVRSIILEPVGGPRPDGVIAAIRRRNAERRGISLRDRQVDPLAKAAAALRSGLRTVRAAPRRAWKAITTLTQKGS